MEELPCLSPWLQSGLYQRRHSDQAAELVCGSLTDPCVPSCLRACLLAWLQSGLFLRRMGTSTSDKRKRLRALLRTAREIAMVRTCVGTQCVYLEHLLLYDMQID
jgi:hypothetical protein